MSAFFLDTNISVYCFDTTEPRKCEIAKDLVAYGASSGLGVVSYQVLQEFCNVASASKRLALPAERITAYLTQLLHPMNKISPSVALLGQALAVRHDTGYSFYDSLIIAAAVQFGCTKLYSEDMQHGQQVNGLTIVNPFLMTANETELAMQHANAL
jgi:predicted nucleic acid-binding protein